MTLTACRFCSGADLAPVLELGRHPPSDAFLTAADLEAPEASHPLDVVRCTGCGLVQLDLAVDRRQLFSSAYLYASSASESMAAHLAGLCREAVARFSVNGNSLAVDIGSNDGTLLAAFRDRGLRTLGVDPSPQVAALARRRGIETREDFWNAAVAADIAAAQGPARVITGTNVFAHTDDPRAFLEAARSLLDPEGVLILEFPYLRDLLEHCQFDTIYHEHLFYYALRPVARLARECGLTVFAVRHVPVHGGSLRVFLGHSGGAHREEPAVAALLAEEEARGLYTGAPYDDFARRAREIRAQVRDLLSRLKQAGRRVAGYGAAAKGNTFLIYCGLGTESVAYLVDRNPLKHGRYTPGTRIPVRPVEWLADNPPHDLLILPWNWKDEIMRQQRAFAENGGRFIVAIPALELFDGPP